MNSFSMLGGTVRQTHDALIAGLVTALDRVTPDLLSTHDALIAGLVTELDRVTLDLLSTLSDGFPPLPEPEPAQVNFEAARAAASTPPPLVPQGVFGSTMAPAYRRRRRSAGYCPVCAFRASTTERMN